MIQVILITGITGFLGRHMTQYLLDHGHTPEQIIGTAHSESKLAYFKKLFPQISSRVQLVDFAHEHLAQDLERLIQRYEVTHIIHTAAMKHVDICQDNPIMAVKVNTLGVATLINVAKKCHVQNVVALSTDKTNNPCNTYGMCKYIMQEYVLANDYSVYQGANFFWSDGSVLDIWLNQHNRHQPLTIRDGQYIRYFNTIDHVCQTIYQHLDDHGKIILPDHVYRVSLHDLLKVFMEYFQDHNFQIVPPNSYEKQVEILRDEITQTIDLNQDKLKDLFHQTYTKLI
jgi:UDP-N-acetylglucosamine 4,6-dehydratase/5-epimerase